MEKILILDFKHGANALIFAEKIRSQGVYCDILPFDTTADAIAKIGYDGIIFASQSILCDDELRESFDIKIFDLGIPVLAIGAGALLMAKTLGGVIENTEPVKQKAEAIIDSSSRLFSGIPQKTEFLMSYCEQIEQIPVDFKIIAKTLKCHVAAMECVSKRLFAVMFRPEDILTENGDDVIHNFLYRVCGCTGEWTPSFLSITTVRALKEKIGNKKVFCPINGDLKSTVCALLLHRAVADRLICVFTDNGLTRMKTARDTVNFLADENGIRIVGIDARARFIGQLRGINENSQKRKTVCRELSRVLCEQIKALGGTDFISSDSLYLSREVKEDGLCIAETVKEYSDGCEMVTPLSNFLESDIKRAAQYLGVPSPLIHQSHMPVGGLCEHISGEITEEKLTLLSRVDEILCDEMVTLGAAPRLYRYYAELGGGEDGYTVTVCAHVTKDHKSVSYAKLPFEVLDLVSRRILSELDAVNRVLYDITAPHS